MLDGVRSGLKMVKFLSQHFWMLQDVARVWQMLADVALKRCVRFAGP